jgi:ABC-type multidrug transport system fused ATPase/permease subunit
LAIARAFVKDAPILLLDEPTSALDHRSREHVLQGLENLKANRTTLIISHQPETLLSIDRTLYLKQGVISPSNA